MKYKFLIKRWEIMLRSAVNWRVEAVIKCEKDY